MRVVAYRSGKEDPPGAEITSQADEKGSSGLNFEKHSDVSLPKGTLLF